MGSPAVYHEVYMGSPAVYNEVAVGSLAVYHEVSPQHIMHLSLLYPK